MAKYLNLDGLQTLWTKIVNTFAKKSTSLNGYGITDGAVSKELTTENLNNVTSPGFYNAGGNNTVTNKPSGIDWFGLEVIHDAGGNYYTQKLYSGSKSYTRHCTNSTWGNWSEDKLTDTTYSSKTAASGGTDVSLVTTGEKYTWNSKASTAVATTSANGLMSSKDKTKFESMRRYSPVACTYYSSNKSKVYGELFNVTEAQTYATTTNHDISIGGVIYFCPANGTCAETDFLASVRSSGGSTVAKFQLSNRKFESYLKMRYTIDTDASTGKRKYTIHLYCYMPNTYERINVALDYYTLGDVFARTSIDSSYVNLYIDKTVAEADLLGTEVSAIDLYYSSLNAASGGKDVSLVTTGEKAIWNAKTSNTGTVTSVAVKMNNAVKGTVTDSGTIDLGTVVTDVSGKENTTNKVTSWSSTTSDTKYPSEKLVKTDLDKKANKATNLTGSTKCKITYDNQGIVTGGADLTDSDIPTITKSKISDFPTSLPANGGTSDIAKYLRTSEIGSTSYVTNDTHYMCLGYIACSSNYDRLTLLITSAFWGNQHGSQDIITIDMDNSTNSTKKVQCTLGRVCLEERSGNARNFYFLKDDTNLRLYLYVYVTGGNSYGKWSISALGGSASFVVDGTKNVTKLDTWVEIAYSGRTKYSTIAYKDSNSNDITSTYATKSELPSVVTTSKDGLMSSADKTKLNGIAANANNYTHPTSSGNKHIPSGGSSGKILKWKADGEAQWGDDKDTTYESKEAASGGTDVSLVTTGEKYTWDRDLKCVGFYGGGSTFVKTVGKLFTLTPQRMVDSQGYYLRIGGTAYCKDKNNELSIGDFEIFVSFSGANVVSKHFYSTFSKELNVYYLAESVQIPTGYLYGYSLYMSCSVGENENFYSININYVDVNGSYTNRPKECEELTLYENQIDDINTPNYTQITQEIKTPISIDGSNFKDFYNNLSLGIRFDPTINHSFIMYSDVYGTYKPFALKTETLKTWIDSEIEGYILTDAQGNLDNKTFAQSTIKSLINNITTVKDIHQVANTNEDIHFGFRGASIGEVNPNTTGYGTLESTPYLIACYNTGTSTTAGTTYYKDVKAEKVTVGNALKVGGMAFKFTSSIPTTYDANTVYILT